MPYTFHVLAKFPWCIRSTAYIVLGFYVSHSYASGTPVLSASKTAKTPKHPTYPWMKSSSLWASASVRTSILVPGSKRNIKSEQSWHSCKSPLGDNSDTYGQQSHVAFTFCCRVWSYSATRNTGNTCLLNPQVAGHTGSVVCRSCHQRASLALAEMCLWWTAHLKKGKVDILWRHRCDYTNTHPRRGRGVGVLWNATDTYTHIHTAFKHKQKYKTQQYKKIQKYKNTKNFAPAQVYGLEQIA